MLNTSPGIRHTILTQLSIIRLQNPCIRNRHRNTLRNGQSISQMSPSSFHPPFFPLHADLTTSGMSPDSMSHGLKTTIDSNENIIITSITPGSTLKATTASIDRRTVSPTLICVPYKPAVRAIQFNKSRLMRERCGHISAQRLRLLSIKFHPSTCNFCILGKHARIPFTALDHDATKPLDRVYADHFSRQCAVFVDEATE